MLRNVRLFYTKGNIYELLFASLAIGLALFIMVFSLIGQIGLHYMPNTLLFALFVLFIGVLISALTLRGKQFIIPRATKTRLLVELFISLVIFHMIL